MRLCILFVAWWYTFPVLSQSNEFTLSSQPSWNKPADLKTYTLFYELPETIRLSLNDIRKKPFRSFEERHNKRVEGNRNTSDITWLTFAIRNTGIDTISLLLNCNVHHSVTVYDDNRFVGKTGFLYNDLNPIPIVIPPGESHTFWVEVVDVIVAVLPLIVELHTVESYLTAKSEDLYNVIPLIMLMSVWCGCFIFMSLYSLYRFYLNRDRVFLYYGVFSFQLFWVCLFALSNRLNLHLVPYGFTFLVFPTYCLFIARIIDIQKRKPAAWTYLKILMIVCLGQESVNAIETFALHRPLIPFIEYYDYQYVVGLVVVTSCFGMVVLSKSQIRRYLTAGILAMIFIGLIPVIINPYFDSEAGWWEPIINYPFTFAFAGFVFENLCFAMALAYRSQLVEAENNNLHKTYSEKLERELAAQASEIRETNKVLEQRTVDQLKASYEQRLLQMETTALRAQMNPHFIFNCLNSIKLYTLEHDSAGAADYLTRFARLIRLVLENSQAEKISLAVELETLQLYVDMECMRFKNRFSFTIKTGENVDPEFIDIPPMLLQPYIENAIWHGLMHKTTHGNIELMLEMHDSHLLKVEVTDDGIGRTRAGELKSKSATRQKSFGMKVNAERIALINHHSKEDMMISIEDLVTPDGQPAGTKVILLIPV